MGHWYRVPACDWYFRATEPDGVVRPGTDRLRRAPCEEGAGPEPPPSRLAADGSLGPPALQSTGSGQ